MRTIPDLWRRQEVNQDRPVLVFVCGSDPETVSSPGRTLSDSEVLLVDHPLLTNDLVSKVFVLNPWTT